MSDLLDAVRAADVTTLERLTAEDVTFHSPVADYRGRADVVHLLCTIGTVLDEIEAEETLYAPSVEVTMAKIQVGEHEADASIRQEVDEDGKIVDLTLMLRPLEALTAAADLMGRALAADPLPSQSAD